MKVQDPFKAWEASPGAHEFVTFSHFHSIAHFFTDYVFIVLICTNGVFSFFPFFFKASWLAWLDWLPFLLVFSSFSTGFADRGKNIKEPDDEQKLFVSSHTVYSLHF